MERRRALTADMVFTRTKCNRIDLIRNLNLWGNDIHDISLVRDMPNLEVLSLSVNRVSSLADLKHCHKLSELYLRKNDIRELSEVQHLVNLQHLKVLWLNDNPCAVLPNYRNYVLQHLPGLAKLDSQDVTDGERRRAAHLGTQDFQTAAVDLMEDFPGDEHPDRFSREASGGPPTPLQQFPDEPQQPERMGGKFSTSNGGATPLTRDQFSEHGHPSGPWRSAPGAYDRGSERAAGGSGRSSLGGVAPEMNISFQQGDASPYGPMERVAQSQQQRQQQQRGSRGSGSYGGDAELQMRGHRSPIVGHQFDEDRWLGDHPARPPDDRNWPREDPRAPQSGLPEERAWQRGDRGPQHAGPPDERSWQRCDRGPQPAWQSEPPMRMRSRDDLGAVGASLRLSAGSVEGRHGDYSERADDMLDRREAWGGSGPDGSTLGDGAGDREMRRAMPASVDRAGRADNILCAVMALVKELDRQGLELTRRAIEQRQSELRS